MRKNSSLMSVIAEVASPSRREERHNTSRTIHRAAFALTFFFMALAFISTAIAGEVKGTGTFDGNKRDWLFYVPDGIAASPALVIYLQGCCTGPEMYYSLGYNKVADTEKILVLYPAAINTSSQMSSKDWDVTSDRDLKFIMALLDTAIAKYNIDQNRVYAAGFSMGGYMSNYLGCMYPDKFAAIAPAAGSVLGFKDEPRTTCKKTRPIPMHHMGGTKDQLVSYTSRQVPSVEYWVKSNECPTTATVTSSYNGKSNLKKEVWGPCKDSTEVVFITNEGGSHSPMSVSKQGAGEVEEAWPFLKRWSLKKTPTGVIHVMDAQAESPSFSPSACYHIGTIVLHRFDNAASARLFDTKGRMVRAWDNINGQGAFTVQPLSKGVYLLSVNRMASRVRVDLLLTVQ